MISDLVRTGMTKEQAEAIANKMSAQSIKLASEIATGDMPGEEIVPDVQLRGEFYHVAPGVDVKPFFKISVRHYNKLQTLFQRHANVTTTTVVPPNLNGITNVDDYCEWYYENIEDDEGWEKRQFMHGMQRQLAPSN